MLKKYYFFTVLITIFCLFNTEIVCSSGSDACKQSLVALLENNADKAKLHELYQKCAAHGNAEKQLRSARELAQTLKKSQVVERADQTLHEMNLEQQKASEIAQKSEGWSLWKWALAAWAFLGCCVAVEREIDDYYMSQPIKTEEEETEQKKKELLRKQARKN